MLVETSTCSPQVLRTSIVPRFRRSIWNYNHISRAFHPPIKIWLPQDVNRRHHVQRTVCSSNCAASSVPAFCSNVQHRVWRTFRQTIFTTIALLEREPNQDDSREPNFNALAVVVIGLIVFSFEWQGCAKSICSCGNIVRSFLWIILIAKRALDLW